MRFVKHLLLVLAIASLAACGPKRPTPATPAISSPSARGAAAPTLPGLAWDHHAPFRRGLIPGEEGVLDGLLGATVYQIDLQIADDLTRLQAQQEVRYINTETVDLNEVYFRLFPSLFGTAVQVGAVRADGRGVSPDYTLQDSAMRVPLSQPLRPGEAVVMTFAFSVTVPTDLVGSYGAFAYVDDVLALAHFYPLVADDIMAVRG